VLEEALSHLFTIPFLGLELLLLGIVTLNPILDTAIHHLQEYGLRACPSTPNPTQDRREEKNEDEEGDRKNGEEHKILRPEFESKDREFAVDDIQKENGLTRNLHPRNAKEDDQQNKTYDLPCIVVTPIGTFRKESYPATRCINVVQLIAKYFRFHNSKRLFKTLRSTPCRKQRQDHNILPYASKFMAGFIAVL
ncbi:MAG: hypothetical protein U0176_26815, partial [Bacteroidia bacterium]